MKIKAFILLFFVGIFSISARAQRFLNGSLEPNGSSSFTVCADNDVAHVNSIPNVFLEVSAPHSAYIADGTCPSGPAELDSHYMGVFYSPHYGYGSKILLRLSTTMPIDQPFNFTFYYKGPPAGFGNAADLEYGVGIDSAGTTDTLVLGTITAPVGDVWMLQTGSIPPGHGGSTYIWIGARRPSIITDSAITFIDNFSANPVEISQVENAKKIKLYPNPMSNTSVLTLDNSIVLPCEVNVCDVTGRNIHSYNSVQTKNITIRKNDLINGLYFVKVRGHDGKEYVTKLVVE